MVVRIKEHKAGSKKSFEYCLKKYPKQKELARDLISLILKKSGINQKPKILEIGAAQGSFTIACQELGYTCIGIEPSLNALEVSKQLCEKLNVNIKIDKGVAEALPYDDESFDLVIALSVMEHVQNVEQVVNETYRVLKSNGAFYFITTSALCPMQGEIRFFPFFSWYPDKLKKKIMIWSMNNKPSLIGYSDAPAINWFTPWKTTRLLKKVGFYKIFDQWDLYDPTKKNTLQNNLIKIIRLNIVTRFIAGLFSRTCSYLAIKK